MSECACEVSQGIFGRMLMEPGASPHTFDANSERYEFMREKLVSEGRIVVPKAIWGTRSEPSERARNSVSYVSGPIEMLCSPGQFLTLAPKILGNNESPTGTFNVAEDVPYFGVMMDRGADVFVIKDAKVDKAIIRGRSPKMMEEGEPELLALELRLLAKDEDNTVSWPGSAPSLSVAANQAPFVFSDATVTINGTAYEMEEFVLMVDNDLEVRFVNSLTPFSICPKSRSVLFRCSIPFCPTSYASLYPIALAGATGSLAFTNGTISSTFNFGRLQVPKKSPFIPGRTGLSLVLDGVLRSYSTTKEITLVNDSTV